MPAQSNQKVPLINNLLNSACYPHPTRHIELVETHISWLILTGHYAYKIKKPVNLGFLDFSSLDKRHHYCLEEIRLNRRTAPAIYLDVIPVTGSIASPIMGGDSQVIEWAVKMKQFDKDALLRRIASEQDLDNDLIDQLATVVADFHQHIPHADPGSDFGSPQQTWQPVEDNFTPIRSAISDPVVMEKLDHIMKWQSTQHRRLRTLFEHRKRTGAIRECHGDLHTGNIAIIHNKPVIFDCIEFSNDLRWIDTANDLSFLIMDLLSLGHEKAAYRLLNRYLEISGDYQAMALLAYYQVYRAMVRAKVSCIMLQSLADKGQQTGRKTELEKFNRYLDLALELSSAVKPAVFLTHGVSGSGKTTVSQLLLELLPAIRIRSDIERKRLFGLKAEDHRQDTLHGGIYTSAASRKTYQHLESEAAGILAAGYHVIVDAAFLKQAQRQIFFDLAQKNGLPCIILSCSAPREQLEQWLRQRQTIGKDASDANIAVLDEQCKTQQPLTDSERTHTIMIDTSRTIDSGQLLESAQQLARKLTATDAGKAIV